MDLDHVKKRRKKEARRKEKMRELQREVKTKNQQIEEMRSQEKES